ncbi:MAG: hypothetical protein HAW66_04160 [Shewanella sp.]|nr:hypothetical protein [Shewanella sp.]
MASTDSKLQFSQRLNTLLDRKNFPPKNMGRISLVAEIFEITHKGAGNWLNGKAIPARKTLKMMSDHFDVSEDWLIFGHSENSNTGNFDIPVVKKAQIASFLDGSLSEFERFLSVQDSKGSRSFVIDMQQDSFDVDFLITHCAKLIFDPDLPPVDKLFALIQSGEELLIKLLIEYEKGRFAITKPNKNQKTELLLLDHNTQMLALLTEIKFR